MGSKPGIMAADKVQVFIDLDGTLADSLGVLRHAYESFLKKYGRKGSEAEFQRLNGPTTLQVAEALRTAHKIPLSVSQMRRAYIAHLADVYLKKVKPMPGADRLLASLTGKGFKVHLVTSSLRPIALKWVEARGWKRYFSTCTFGDEVKRGKPDPEIYRLAFRRARTAPESAIVIEDSANGCRSGKAAGAEVLLVAGGHKGVLDVPVADHAVRDLSTLKVFFKQEDWKRLRSTPLAAGAFDVRLVPGAKVPARAANNLLCLQRIERKARTVFLGRYRAYRGFISALRAGRPHGQALAVSGLTTVRTAGGTKFLVGLRSKQVSTYRNTWEWVPSGGIDPDGAGGNGSIDLKKMLLKEFTEEAGLRSDRVLRAERLGVIRDRAINTYDFVLHLELRPGVDREPLCYPEAEYSRMSWMNAAAVKRLVRSGAKVIPAFYPIWNLYEQRSARKGPQHKGKRS